MITIRDDSPMCSHSKKPLDMTTTQNKIWEAIFWCHLQLSLSGIVIFSLWRPHQNILPDVTIMNSFMWPPDNHLLDIWCMIDRLMTSTLWQTRWSWKLTVNLTCNIWQPRWHYYMTNKMTSPYYGQDDITRWQMRWRSQMTDKMASQDDKHYNMIRWQVQNLSTDGFSPRWVVVWCCRSGYHYFR
jgi:hypothetical protein